MRELVAARGLVAEFWERMKYNLSGTSKVSKVWEDNLVAQNLANSKGLLISSRTRHIGIQYNWFRSHISKNTIKINCIDTKEQFVNIFTKYLTRFPFE